MDWLETLPIGKRVLAIMFLVAMPFIGSIQAFQEVVDNMVSCDNDSCIYNDFDTGFCLKDNIEFQTQDGLGLLVCLSFDPDDEENDDD